jgi:hypothetical protein
VDGVTGAVGLPGTDGVTGPTGPAGLNGTTGASGPTGSAGLNGTTGATGPTGASGAVLDIRTVSSNVTLDSTDDYVLCSPSANTTVTLPAAASNTGHMITVKRITTTAATCSVSGIATIDATTGTQALSAPTSGGQSGNMISVVSNGSNWYLVNFH